MANHVKTILRITANRKEDLDLLLKKVVSSVDYILDINKRNNREILDVGYAVIPKMVGEVDFNILIPQPTSIFQGSVNHEIEEQHGGAENCWYKWREEHWGTCRNCYEDTVEWLSDNEVEITMWTAWSEPIEWLNALAEYAFGGELGITDIEGEFANEDFGQQMGFFDTNASWHEDKENEDVLGWHYYDMDRDCYERVWGEGALEGTGYELN